MNDGVRSSWKGHRPLSEPGPAGRSVTCSRTTSSIDARSLTAAMSSGRILPRTAPIMSAGPNARRGGAPVDSGIVSVRRASARLGARAWGSPWDCPSRGAESRCDVAATRQSACQSVSPAHSVVATPVAGQCGDVASDGEDQQSVEEVTYCCLLPQTNASMDLLDVDGRRRQGLPTSVQLRKPLAHGSTAEMVDEHRAVEDDQHQPARRTSARRCCRTQSAASPSQS